MNEPVFKLSRPLNTPVSEEEVIADLRRVVEMLGTETVTQNQYNDHGRYTSRTAENRFGSWNKALKIAGLDISVNKEIADEELIEDLQQVARSLGTKTISAEQYNSNGKYSQTTQRKRFGSWNKALRRAGLEISKRMNIPEEELFENILILWRHYGRQPRFNETFSPPSRISGSPYQRFGSWMNALKAFVDYANGTGAEPAERPFETGMNYASGTSAEIAETQDETGGGGRHKTGRDPSLRLRWRVLQRDNFKCCACGASPAITLGVELHVDHIHPWSEGGETVLENLQTLCSKCNLGKSNLLP